MNEILIPTETVRGEFQLFVHRHGRERLRTAVIPNLILNSGLDYLMGGSRRIISLMSACLVGTSNVAPAKTQLGLGNSIASTTSTYASSIVTAPSGPDLISSYQYFYSFALGSVVGNITEVGIRPTEMTGSNTATRALIKDASGNPVAITLTSEDQLYVAYTIYSRAPAYTPITGSMTVTDPNTSSPVVLPYEIYPVYRVSGTTAAGHVNNTLFANTQGYSAVMGDNTPPAPNSTIAGFAIVTAAKTLQPYTNGNYYRDVDFTIPPTLGNITGGIGKIIFGPGEIQAHCIVFPTTKLPKTSVARFNWRARFGIASI